MCKMTKHKSINILKLSSTIVLKIGRDEGWKGKYYLRCLEGLGELVAEFAPRVDGEDARDRDPHGAVRVHILLKSGTRIN